MLRTENSVHPYFQVTTVVETSNGIGVGLGVALCCCIGSVSGFNQHIINSNNIMLTQYQHITIMLTPYYVQVLAAGLGAVSDE